jgi:hypothetical protein
VGGATRRRARHARGDGAVEGAPSEEDCMEAYCMKCRTKREMNDPKPITMKNGKPATEGICPHCGTRMFKIGKTEAHTG